MKKSTVIICLMMILAFSLQAQQIRKPKPIPESKSRTLVITKLNTDSIRIGDKFFTVGDKFSDNEVIHWSSAKQEMWVKYTEGNDRDKKCLTQRAFAKVKAKSVREYYGKTNHTSSRATPPRKNQKASENKHKGKAD